MPVRILASSLLQRPISSNHALPNLRKPEPELPQNVIFFLQLFQTSPLRKPKKNYTLKEGKQLLGYLWVSCYLYIVLVL